jgi:hypothetical protein
MATQYVSEGQYLYYQFPLQDLQAQQGTSNLININYTWSTQDGTATANEDYIPNSGDQSNTGSRPIIIKNDNDQSGQEETFQIVANYTAYTYSSALDTNENTETSGEPDGDEADLTPVSGQVVTNVIIAEPTVISITQDTTGRTPNSTVIKGELNSDGSPQIVPDYFDLTLSQPLAPGGKVIIDLKPNAQSNSTLYKDSELGTDWSLHNLPNFSPEYTTANVTVAADANGNPSATITYVDGKNTVTLPLPVASATVIPVPVYTIGNTLIEPNGDFTLGIALDPRSPPAVGPFASYLLGQIVAQGTIIGDSSAAASSAAASMTTTGALATRVEGDAGLGAPSEAGGGSQITIKGRQYTTSSYAHINLAIDDALAKYEGNLEADFNDAANAIARQLSRQGLTLGQISVEVDSTDRTTNKKGVPVLASEQSTPIKDGNVIVDAGLAHIATSGTNVLAVLGDPNTYEMTINLNANVLATSFYAGGADRTKGGPSAKAMTVLEHELIHGLGVGTNPSTNFSGTTTPWLNRSHGTIFTGKLVTPEIQENQTAYGLDQYAVGTQIQGAPVGGDAGDHLSPLVKDPYNKDNSGKSDLMVPDYSQSGPLATVSRLDVLMINDMIAQGGLDGANEAPLDNDPHKYKLLPGDPRNFFTPQDGISVETPLGPGQSSFQIDPTFDYANAGDGEMTITGSANADDSIVLGSGNKTVNLGDGTDVVTVTPGSYGNITVHCGAGPDSDFLGDGNNTLIGGPGGDFFEVGNGNNTMTGGTGADTFIFGSGNNTIDGGAGINIAQFIGASTDYQLTTLPNGALQFRKIATGATDTLSNIQTYQFSDGTFTRPQIEKRPGIVQVVAGPANGVFGAGATIFLTLDMSEAVTVTGGTPSVSLGNGASAVYVTGSGTTGLTFRYTVGISDADTAALSVTRLNLNGATIANGSGAAIDPWGATASFPNIEIEPLPLGAVYSVLAAPASPAFPQAINNSGQIVGYYQDANGTHGFLESGGTITTIDAPGAVSGTFLQGINATGEIAGYYLDASNIAHGFTKVGGTYTFLPPFSGNGGSYAEAVTDSGGVVGYYLDGSNVAHGFFSVTSSSFGGINVPWVNNGTYVTGINNAGQTVGYYLDSTNRPHGFVGTSGAYTALDDPLATSGTKALGINASGQAVGTYSDGGGTHGFLYSGGGYLTLEVPGANQGTFVQGINSSDQMTGSFGVSPNQHSGFIGSLQPAVLSVVAPPNLVSVGRTLALTLTFSEAVTVAAGSPSLALSNGGTAVYASGSGTSALTFNYAVGSGDSATTALAVTGFDLQGATIQDAAGNEAFLSGALTALPGVRVKTSETTPTVTVANAMAPRGQTSIAASSLFTASDPDGDSIAQFAFWNTGAGGGRFAVNGFIQGTNQEIDVTAAQLAQVTYRLGSGGDTLWVRANDGTLWSPWSNSFTVSAWSQVAPTVSVANIAAAHGQAFAASSLYTASDPDGDAIATYGFWDTGAGGGHFVLNGVVQGTNREIDVTAAQLAQLSYQSGVGADTLWVRANDGTSWSAWSSAFTVTGPPDSGPLVNASNFILDRGQSTVAASSLFAAVDPDGDTPAQYAFWNNGAGGGRFLVNGVVQAINAEIDVSASQLAQVSYRAGSGADTVWVRANDGFVWSAWSSGFSVSPWIQTAPVVTVFNRAAAHGQSFAASSLFAAGDGDGDPLVTYGFWNTGAGGGHFVLNGVAQGTNREIDVAASQLAHLSYQTGTGADTLWVRANDGTLWSPWSNSFTVTAPPDSGPMVLGGSAVLAKGQSSVAASTLFTAFDSDGDTPVQYALWNTGAGGGRFLVNGVAQGTNVEIDVPAAQLAQVSYQAGSGADTVWVRANDGYVWGAWSPSFTVSPWMQTAPTVVVANVTAAKGQTSLPAAALLLASDSDGDAITQYDFWDTGAGGGRFLLNGVAQGINQDIYVSAAQLAQTSYQVGTSLDTVWVRVNDGTQWSAWSSSFTVGPTVDTAPVVTVSNLATPKGSLAASSLLAAYDPDGDAIVQYDFWDSTGNGHFVINGAVQGTNRPFVTATQLAQTVYATGRGSDQLWVRANDGTQWNAWQSFNVTPPVDTPATVSVASVTAAKNQVSVAASTLFTATDQDGDAITQYDFWNTGAGGGRFLVNGVQQGTNQDVYVTAAQLAQASYRFGSQ